MPRYTVKSPIRTAGRRWETGSQVEMSEDTAAPLVARGRLAEAEPASEAPKAAGKGKAKTAKAGDDSEG